MLKLFFYISFIVVCFSPTARSQVAASEANFLNVALKNADQEYISRIGFQSLIYNGIEYVDYDNRINGHPYFNSEYYEIGSLIYDSMSYDSIYMKYDVVKQLLVLRYYDEKGYKQDIALRKDNIDEFNLMGHHFIQMKDSAEAVQLDPGFYDILYDRDFSILCRREKEYVEELEDRALKKNFYTRDHFFILNDGEISEVKNKRSTLKTFYLKKKELKKFIKQTPFDFKNDFENSLLQVVKYYETLTE